MKLKLDDFIDFKYPSDLKFSPDGDKICFVQTEADLENNNYQKFLWIHNLKTKKTYKLTNSGKDGSYIWYDDENIIFISNREEKKEEDKKPKTFFYTININGGEAQKKFEIEETVTSFEMIDKTKFAMTIKYDGYLEKIPEEEREEEKDYHVFDEIPFWSNGQGFTSKVRNRLYIYNTVDKKTEPVVNELTNVRNIKIKDDTIYFIANTYKDMMEHYDSILKYDVKGKKIETLIDESEKLSIPSMHILNDEKLIFTGSDMKKYGLNENRKFYTLKLKDKSYKCITPNFEYSLWNSVGSDARFGGGKGQEVFDGKLYFTSTRIKDSFLYSIDEYGNIEEVIKNDGTVDVFDISKNGIYFIGFRGLRIPEVYSYINGTEEKITSFNDWLVEERDLSKPEHFTFENSDGVEIDGWVMKPVNYEKGKKYPTILDIHGGPKTAYGDIYYHEMQYWANEGYAVIFCNPRGSDGKDNEFADIRGKFGKEDFRDIMEFVDQAVEKYKFINEDKMGVTGGSYGGFMTNWIIGNTNRFKAAASQRSISNWISKSMVTDIGYYFVQDQQAGNAWTDPEGLWEQSPLKYANKAKTPTLFIHSDEDYRCYKAEGYQMFTALKLFGVEARFVLFDGENHELSRSGKPKHRIRRLKEITQWMDKYLN